jgi:uncharacterized hydrophobic protein (TIGR00271 family)
MTHSLAARALPPQQRRSLAELSDDLDLTRGDAVSKRSAFWTMLVLSAVIAVAGVLADSTATVIGAMIIAPLSTPIMGVALGVVQRDRRLVWRSARTVALGVLVVVGVGTAFALVVPGEFDLLGNGQIAGRVSPGLVDLIAAMATGFAGAVALARRDVAAVLPGVAIAISLVPPLVVVGVCLGQGAVALAVGALVLFFSNFLALVLAGMLVFTAAGYAAEASDAAQLSRRRATLVIASLLVVVLIPLAANTVGTYFVTVWTGRVQTTAEHWIASTPGASIVGVDVQARTVTVEVQAPGELPPVSQLVADLQGRIPNGTPVFVTTSVGQRIEAGVVGS